MKTFLTISSSVILSILGAYFLVSYTPLSFFPDIVHRTFGSTVTTILGSDTISGSRTTINTNFSNLNSDKAENTVATLASLTSAAALATVGTITSGTWNGGVIFPTWGGSGSSTLSSNQILLGNGTGAVKVVNGFGTSGQFLTSNGAGQAPSFQSASVDQTQNYSWTGNHNFIGNTYIKNLNASSTVVLGGITYTSPPSQAFASSTVLANDGAGKQYWINQSERLLFANFQVNLGTTANSATTSLYTVAIPAGTLTVSSFLRMTMNAITTGNAGERCSYDVSYGDGNATTSIGEQADDLSQTPIQIQTTLSATGTTQELAVSQGLFRSQVNVYLVRPTINNTVTNYISWGAKKQSASGSVTCTILGGSVEVISY